MKDLKGLIRGFQQFQQRFFQDDKLLFEQLQKQQSPKVMVIGCSDSRVDPAILTNCLPGDLFVVRNVANLVGPYKLNMKDISVSSAVEYAVQFLQIKHLIVLGHSHCGGIKALLQSEESAKAGEFIDCWVDIARPAKEAVLRDMSSESFDLQCAACEQAAVRISLENLLTYPWVAQRVQEGKLMLHGWYFDLDTGQMLGYNAQTNTFDKLTAEE